jgi:predicted dienelactone hydrolase
MRRAPPVLALGALALGALAPVAACNGKTADSAQADTAPAELDLATFLTNPGPHGVGFAVSELSYPDPAGDGDRPLHLATWYPSTEDTAGAEIRYRGAFLRTDAVEGAARTEGTFPVAIFSHGHQGFAEASSFLMAHLASHGWVVVAPDHTGNTTFDSPDRETPIYYQRPLDLSATLDHVLAQPGNDAEHVVAMGHSFGGYTLFSAGGARYDEAVIAACLDGSDTSEYCSTMTADDAARFDAGFSEPRVSAWIALAPGDQRLFGDAGLSGLSAPVLLMSGSVDPRTGGDTAPYWAALDRGENRHVSVIGGGHQTFTDFSGTLENPEGLISAEDGFPIVEGYVLAFANRHGLGDTRMQPALDGDISWSDAAVLVE